VVKKASFSMVERGLVKKVSISSLKMIVAGLSKKKKKSKSCQKVQKVVKHFVKPGKN
jgi:hypothetical protein